MLPDHPTAELKDIGAADDEVTQACTDAIKGGRGAPPILHGIVGAMETSGRLIYMATLVILFVELMANVILHYVMGCGLKWAYDIQAILLPWLIASSIAIATVQNRNTAMTILPDLLSPSVRRGLFILVSVLTLLISAFMVWSAFPIIKAAQYGRSHALCGINEL